MSQNIRNKITFCHNKIYQYFLYNEVTRIYVIINISNINLLLKIYEQATFIPQPITHPRKECDITQR